MDVPPNRVSLTDNAQLVMGVSSRLFMIAYMTIETKQ
jgi:hypothetical protein